mgnify:CR=1 FL=1
MSYQPDPLSNSLNLQTIQSIEKLNLPIMQKHHLRILLHCLAMLNSISIDNSFSSDQEDLLKQWCNSISRKFNDQQFSDLLYEQLAFTAKKLNLFSQKIGKDIKDLDIEDLVLLVKESTKTI